MLMLIARYSALVLVTAIVIWALVLGWWQSNNHTPSMAESFLYLFALPIALVGGFAFLNAFFKGMRAPATVAQSASAAPVSSEPDSLAGDAEARRRQLAVLGVGIIASGANDASGCIELVREGRTPKPDSRIKDEDGFPAFVARCDAIDESLRAEHLVALSSVSVWSEAQLRSIALADEVLLQVIPEVASLAGDESGSPFFIHIVWLIDAEVDATQSASLQDWLRIQHMTGFDADRLDVTIVPTDDPIAAATQIEHLITLAPGEKGPGLNILIASGSNVTEARIRSWQSRGMLFLPDQQQAQIPGEAASALILATPETAARLGIKPPLLISRPNARSRDKSADAGGRVSATLSTSLCQELLKLFDVEASRVTALVTDSDHRTSRQSEALGALDDTFEQLDPAQDFLATGTACASATPASFLLTLACAAHLAEESARPVLALSVQDPTRRAALLLTLGQEAPLQPSPE